MKRLDIRAAAVGLVALSLLVGSPTLAGHGDDPVVTTIGAELTFEIDADGYGTGIVSVDTTAMVQEVTLHSETGDFDDVVEIAPNVFEAGAYFGSGCHELYADILLGGKPGRECLLSLTVEHIPSGTIDHREGSH